MWKVTFVSHDSKGAGSRQDAIFITQHPIPAHCDWLQRLYYQKLNIMFFLFFIMIYLLHTDMIWNLCTENSLLPSGYRKSNEKYGHWKMTKKLKTLMQNIIKGRHRFLPSVCVHPANNPHTHQSGCSHKSNACPCDSRDATGFKGLINAAMAK